VSVAWHSEVFIPTVLQSSKAWIMLLHQAQCHPVFGTDLLCSQVINLLTHESSWARLSELG